MAAGTYTPTVGVGQWAAFTLTKSVALYGGFPATGTPAFGDRAPKTHVTTLSGDRLGNDGPNFANNAENSYHVVVGIGLTETALLDGFTITGGNGNHASPPLEWGGGMYLVDSTLAISNVTFLRNSAAAGGGLFASGGQPVLTNVEFVANRATINGGGMHTFEQSNAVLSHVTFISNTASGSGQGRGGGLYNHSNSAPSLTNVTFMSNTASIDGGGLFNINSSPTLSAVTFLTNTATGNGGGVFNDHSAPTFSGVDLSGNRAAYGGGLYDYYSTSALTTVPSSATRPPRRRGFVQQQQPPNADRCRL